jgi:hypothetical protein
MPSSDVLLSAVGYGLLLPAAVAVVALVLAIRLGGGESLAVGIGLASGFAALAATKQIERDFLWPAEAWDWLPALGLLGCIWVAVAQLPNKFAHLIDWTGRAVVAGLAAWLLVRAQSKREDEPLVAHWYAALGFAIIILWCVLDWAAWCRPGRVMPLLLALVGLAAAVLAELAGLSTVAQLAGVAAGALIGWAVVALLRPSVAVCRAGVPVVAILLPASLFVAYFNSFSDVPTTSYLLLLAAPLALGLAALLPLWAAPSWRRATVEAGAALLPLGVALALAAPR